MGKEKIFASELLKKMTLKEKVAQLSQTVSGYNCYERDGENFNFNNSFKNFINEYGAMGAISNILRSCPWTKKCWGIGIEPHQRVKVANMLQKYVLENSHIQIPVLIEVEANHGVQALGSEMFPTNIGMGCMFNPELYKKVMKSVGKEIRLSANHIAFVTMFDIARDPRWGRCEEFFSEDPYLVSQYAKSAVEGIKEENVLVCCKHYCATGDCFGGINTAEVNVGNRELHEIHLAAVEKAVKAGADVIMAAYNAVDGIPCHANKHLIRNILRDEIGFSGIVLSDGFGVRRMFEYMGYDDLKGSCTALEAGIDLSLADNGAYLNLIKACESGYIKEELIDEAVMRILIKKFELGLFDNPYLEENNELVAYLDNGIQKKLSYESASESVVMLKNNDILPLSKDKKVALIGAHADNLYYQLGDYTSIRKDGEGKTIKEIFENTFSSVEFTNGWSFEGNNDDFENAISIAKKSDVIFVTLGGSSARALIDTQYDTKTGAAVSTKGFLDCGEGRDVAKILLPGNQVELMERLKKLNKPIIALLIQGRPYEITRVCEISDAVLTAWYPGQQGAEAICDIITGKTNPSGKLSVSIPYSHACLPAYYNKIGEDGINDDEFCSNTYADYKRRTLYPFGYGLSYSKFIYEKMNVKKIRKNEFSVDVTVKNNSSIPGKETIQIYIHGRGNSVRRRCRELKAFRKVFFNSYEEKTVTFNLGYDELKIYSANNKYEVEEAEVEILSGSVPDFNLKAVVKTEKSNE